MRTAPVVAESLAFDAEGIAYSARYRDRYHPRHGALAQAAHVFLGGNGLPGRWQGRNRFVILEAGFGLGNNFLATWGAWRSDPRRCERLHFVSIEAHPLRSAELARAHAASSLPALAAALVRAWPPLTPNLHRLAFEGGRVELLLALGDVALWLPEIVAAVDAFYLDGFAPDRNPAMWQPRVMKAIGRLAAPGATAATWSAAGAVRGALAAAGFDVRSAPGSGDKREITLARYAPHFVPRFVPGRAPARRGDLDASAPRDRRALIVGAGLAGCATAWALAEHGWRSTIVERNATIAAQASGNPAGVFHGSLNAHDGPHARFNRAAALHARVEIGDAIAAHGAAGQIDGLIRLESAATADAMAARLASLGLPPEYVQALDAIDAGRLSGLPATAPAWLFPAGGWVDPAAYAGALLAHAGAAAELHTGRAVAALRRCGDAWQALDASGHVVDEASVVILANAAGATGADADAAADIASLCNAAALPLRPIRGQVSMLPAATPGLRLPRVPVAGNGYVLPPLPGGVALFGATVQPGDPDAHVRSVDHEHNLAVLARLTGSAPLATDAALAGRVGWRCTTPDRLPVIGAVADAGALRAGTARIDQPRFVPRTPGLYVFTALASRGITWAALGARTLASQISGAPCPIEASLLDAVDAGRFASRAARRGTGER